MENKINYARNYVDAAIARGTDTTEAMNDAANIYSSSYDEYCAIWDALNAN